MFGERLKVIRIANRLFVAFIYSNEKEREQDFPPNL